MPEAVTLDYTLHVGDVLAELAKMPDRSVQCCVTSPPYWGLRDYGTATWEGGDPECDHRSPTMREGRNEERATLAGSVATNAAQLRLAARSACGKCGAKRIDQQIGLEETPEAYVDRMVAVFREVRRVLRDDGTCWVNMGDGYNGIGGPGKQNGGPIGPTAATAVEGTPGKRIHGLKSKDLIGMPWMLAFALRADGWYLRQDIIWHKPSPMPESCRDRCTKAHEYIFLLSKRERYYYDAEAIKEKTSGTANARGSGVNPKARGYKTPDGWDTGAGGHGSFHRNGREKGKQNESYSAAVVGVLTDRNRRSVWKVASQPFKGAHFATFPPKLIEPCILAGSSPQACPHCGAPWQRQTSRKKLKRSRPNDLTKRTGENGTGNYAPNTVAGVEVQTLGWEPTCKCENNDGSGKSVVLDPFAGSGTTLMVAVEHGRHGLGIELNPKYAEMAHKRMEGLQRRLAI